MSRWSNRQVRIFLERATSDGICSLPLAIWVVVLVTPAALATQIQATHFDWIQTLLVSAASGSLMFGFILLVWRLLLRKLTGIIRIAATVITYGIGGLLQALSVFWFIPRAGGEQTSLLEISYRSVTYLLLMVILLSLGTYVVATSRTHKARVEQVLARRAAVDSLLQEIQHKIRADQQNAIDSIETKLSLELNQIAQESPSAAIASTEHLVGDVVRPLSHQIAQEVPQVNLPDIDPEDYEISWHAIWRRLAVERYLHPLTTTLVIVIYILLLQITLFDASELDTYLLVFPALALGLWLAKWILRRLSAIGSRRTRYTLSTLVIAILAIPAASILTKAAGYNPTHFGLLVTFVIEAVVLTWLITLAFGLSDTIRTRELELDQLDQTITWVRARGNGTLWQANGQLARALHGPVQSELHAALFALRASVSGAGDGGAVGGGSGVAEGVSGGVGGAGVGGANGSGGVGGVSGTDSASPKPATDLIDQLNRSLPKLLVGGHSHQSLLQEIEDTAALWQGICTINLAADTETVDRLAKDSVANDLVISIVQDAVSNSVRHGGATAVTVSLTAVAEDQVELKVVDNGAKGLGEGTAGLGTHIIEECTVSWSLRSETAAAASLHPESEVQPEALSDSDSNSEPDARSNPEAGSRFSSYPERPAHSGQQNQAGEFSQPLRGCVLTAVLPLQVASTSAPSRVWVPGPE